MDMRINNEMWESLCEEVAENFSSGQLISHSWLREKFGIEETDISNFETTEEYDRERDRLQFMYMGMVETLRTTMLNEYKMYMKNSRGEGYTIVNPKDQASMAYKMLIRDVDSSIKGTKMIMYNVRDVPTEQKAKDDDLRAKVGFMEQMFNNLK